MGVNNYTGRLTTAIDNRKEEIIALGEEIYKNPETGFKEFKTAEILTDKLITMGLKYNSIKDIPGIKATLDTGRPGPGLAIIGELDAIVCTGHPHANKETGAVHACGHNIQVAAMIGAAIGIMDSGILDSLSGKIHLLAVPAEEYIEAEYRMELKEKGIIRYFGGKPELLWRGFFDDVDISIMIHSNSAGKKVSLSSSANGTITKRARYEGRASHAGAAPQNGINALYAANLGLMAINSLRETFLEDNYTRVHPIITKGGEIVNVIPHDVRLETLVRGKTMESIINVSEKVDMALGGGAYSMGAKVIIENIPGYFPLRIDSKLSEITKEVARELTGEGINASGHGTGSTDLGDISALMPVVEIGTGGVEGGLHSESYRNVDLETSYILSSKVLAGLTVRLLREDAKLARTVVSGYTPVFRTKSEYFDFADSLFKTRCLP